MKTLLSFLFAVTMIAGAPAATWYHSGVLPSPATLNAGSKVEVFYFHFTRRCSTCLSVEKVTKEALDTQFPELVKKGEITFKSINLDEKEGEALGTKYKIEGQTLVVISGDKRSDLTDKAFMYAATTPDKLKAEVKKAVEEMLK